MAECERIRYSRAMKFSPQQDDALNAVAQWLKNGDRQLFRLFGYAGTGKTTLARHFAEHVDGQVQFAAFTGKAAQVLRAKGASNAKTIHSLIYRPRGEEAISDETTGKMSMSPTFSLNRQSDIAWRQRRCRWRAGRRSARARRGRRRTRRHSLFPSMGLKARASTRVYSAYHRHSPAAMSRLRGRTIRSCIHRWKRRGSWRYGCDQLRLNYPPG